ncbi:MAG TPA: hypothetical protein VGY76_10590 [Solirubrobacteraceae bacterium]|jgi:hypothetical protein|nr:hypothetical protein [Solirubrobacteraceae bacterium]
MAPVIKQRAEAQRPPVPDRLSHADVARLELLASLPAHLEPQASKELFELHSEGCSTSAIARRLCLDRIVVEMEVSRQDTGESDPGVRSGIPVGESVALLTRREMNRLAKGGHIPNVQLRGLVAIALARDPLLTLNAVLRGAGFTNSQGRRALGYAPHPRRSGVTGRPCQTVAVNTAARIARALGRAPSEVAGL